MSSKPRQFTPEFKVAVVERLRKGEAVSALAREFQVKRDRIYSWRDRLDEGGIGNLRMSGRPRQGQSPVRAETQPAHLAEIARLQQIIGKQQAVIDLFTDALQRIENKSALAGRAKSMLPSEPDKQKGD